MRRVELTHDVLCSVVRASRDCGTSARRATKPSASSLPARNASARRARRWFARGRSPRSAGARDRRDASAIFGYLSMKRAQQAEAQAQQTRQLAESARGEAEKLIVYLLDDFYLELEPVGRLDIVAALAKRAVDYYAALPASCAPARPTATARWRWCATARRCARNRCSTKATRRCRRRSTSSASCVRRAIDRRRRRSGSASGSSPKRGWQAARTASPTKGSSCSRAWTC